MAIEFIRPKDLPAAAEVNPNDDIIVDSGASVGKATPTEIVNAGRPVATEQQAVAGTDNDVAMTPLTTAQAIAADGAGIKSDAEVALQGAQTAQGLAEDARDSAQGYASAAGASASSAAGSASGASSSASAAAGSAGTAAGSASTASQAAFAAVTAQGLAEDARDKAEQWAENPEDVEVDPGQFSARHYAAKTQDLLDNSAFASRSDFVAAVASGAIWPVGAVVHCNGISYRFTGADSDIPDLPGWLPAGDVYPDHWKENTLTGVTDMTAAFQSAATFSPHVNLRGTKYLISDTIVFTGRINNTNPEGASLDGVDPTASVIVSNDPSKDWVLFEKGFGNNEGFLTPTVRNVGFQALVHDTFQVQAGAGLRLRRCLDGLIENVRMDGPTTHYLCENVGQMRWSKCISKNQRRGDDALSVWRFTDNPAATVAADKSPRCFGNFIDDCEVYGGRLFEKLFHISVMDGLCISNSHMNNGLTRFHIDPNGVNFKDVVKQLIITNCYFDGNGFGGVTPEHGFYVEATGASAICRVEGIQVNNCFFRVGSGSVFMLDTTPGGVSGLQRLGDVMFSDCEFRQFDGRYFNIENVNIDSLAVVDNISVSGCVFKDGPNGGIGSHGLAGNLQAAVIRGKNVRLTSNTFQGDWTDAGSELIIVPQQCENWVVSGCVFDCDRTNPVRISPLAGEGQSYGHAYTGAPSVTPVSSEGTNVHGYYRRYADGRVVARKIVEFTDIPQDLAYGGIFRTALQALGSWPTAWTVAPHVQVSLQESTAFGTLGGLVTAPTTAAIGTIFHTGPANATVTFKVAVYAEGT